jgi:uncharacterized protein (TIGR03084 family)
VIAAHAPEVCSLIDDLAAEQNSLDQVIAGVSGQEWTRPTASAGWTVLDQIAHLALVDEFARIAVADPAGFEAIRHEAAADEAAFEAETAARGRALSGDQLREFWQQARTECLRLLYQTETDARLGWFGPPMGLRSFVTARLMETWAHGEDVAEALGVSRPPTDRLGHIAHLGVLTRRWSLSSHGMDAAGPEIGVELILPSGRRQHWGPPDREERVTGTVLDFCLVVTQRRHWTRTGLQVQGQTAKQWMEVAQAFAGPPTTAAINRGERNNKS